MAGQGRGMRQGRGGRGRGRNTERGGKKRRMLGFLQPCLLLQLTNDDRHGYDLLQGLDEFMEDGRDYDPSIIYRLLKEMESKGLVRSYEGEESRGPRRKMYHLTTEGRDQLTHWVEDLKRSRNEIDLLLAAYELQNS